MQILTTAHISGDPYLPCPAHVVDVIREAEGIVTLRLRFVDPDIQDAWSFAPGQFNMLYLYGVGEVPISIASDPDRGFYDHTIRVVGRVTEGLSRLEKGATLGLRGPFGRGWPMQQALGRDVLFVSGGLGCAPTVAAINYIAARRAQFGHLIIAQGVKHPDDLIYRDHYARWARLPDTEVLLAADTAGPQWSGRIGFVTKLLQDVALDPPRTLAMMCGPEPMMRSSANALLERGMAAADIYLSLERNMQCAVGHCGHCQYGSKFVCRDGPVFPYHEIRDLFAVAGF